MRREQGASIADERRRGRGEGTIIERTSQTGKTTCLAQVRAGGRRHAKTHSAKPAARKWIRQMPADGEQGTLAKDGGKTALRPVLSI